MSVWKAEIRRRLAGLQLEPTREAAIIEELAQYLDDCYAELLSSGATEAEAHQRTLAELSGSELLARELRRVERQVPQEPIVLGTDRRTNMIVGLWQDLRFGARMLAKKPGFTLVAALTGKFVKGMIVLPLLWLVSLALVTQDAPKPKSAIAFVKIPAGEFVMGSANGGGQ